MAGIPQNFQNISPVIANYDFVDIASGTGYVNFYAGITVDDDILSNFTYYADALSTTANIADTNYTLLIDKDFDVVLNRPLDVQGLGVVNVPVYAGASGVNVYATVLFRKVTGGVESEIVSNNSRTFAPAAGAYSMFGVDLTIPLTHFKIGDTIRLTVDLYGKKNPVSSLIRLGHDPMNRTSDGINSWDATAAVPSRLIFQCPVRLNL